MHCTPPSLVPLFAVLAFLSSPAARAQAPHVPPAAEAARPALHLDVEVDPTAYALGGYSGHLGLGLGRVRLDLGAYAMDLPGFLESDAAFRTSFSGFGAKLQYFFRPARTGPFVGVDAGLTRLKVRHADSGEVGRQDQLGVGVHGGWRIALPWNLYATPWLGVGYSPNARAVQLRGDTYHPSAVTLFPAVHLG